MSKHVHRQGSGQERKRGREGGASFGKIRWSVEVKQHGKYRERRSSEQVLIREGSALTEQDAASTFEIRAGQRLGLLAQSFVCYHHRHWSQDCNLRERATVSGNALPKRACLNITASRLLGNMNFSAFYSLLCGNAKFGFSI